MLKLTLVDVVICEHKIRHYQFI